MPRPLKNPKIRTFNGISLKKITFHTFFNLLQNEIFNVRIGFSVLMLWFRSVLVLWCFLLRKK